MRARRTGSSFNLKGKTRRKKKTTKTTKANWASGSAYAKQRAILTATKCWDIASNAHEFVTPRPFNGTAPFYELFKRECDFEASSTRLPQTSRTVHLPKRKPSLLHCTCPITLATWHSSSISSLPSITCLSWGFTLKYCWLPVGVEITGNRRTRETWSSRRVGITRRRVGGAAPERRASVHCTRALPFPGC